MALARNICAPLGTLSTFSFNPIFQLSTAKNEINLFNNHAVIVAPVTFAIAAATPPSAEYFPASILYKSIVGRYRPVSYPESRARTPTGDR